LAFEWSGLGVGLGDQGCRFMVASNRAGGLVSFFSATVAWRRDLVEVQPEFSSRGVVERLARSNEGLVGWPAISPEGKDTIARQSGCIVAAAAAARDLVEQAFNGKARTSAPEVQVGVVRLLAGGSLGRPIANWIQPCRSIIRCGSLSPGTQERPSRVQGTWRTPWHLKAVVSAHSILVPTNFFGDTHGGWMDVEFSGLQAWHSRATVGSTDGSPKYPMRGSGS